MNQPAWITGSALTLAIAGGVWVAYFSPTQLLEAPVTAPTTDAVTPDLPLPQSLATTSPQATAAAQKTNETPESNDEDIPPDSPLNLERVASFIGSELEGDKRAPPIGKPTPAPVPPPEALGRPDLYQSFERAQEEKIHRAFIAAAVEQEKALAADISKARATGMPPEQVAEGEEKLNKLRESRLQLQQRYPDTLTTTPTSPSPTGPSPTGPSP